MNPASFARKAIKAAVLPPGLLTRRRPGDMMILLYHRVGAGRGEIGLPIGAFERQVATIAERDTPLHLDQALGGASRGGVVVTVDDGYRDFYDHALPVLLRHKMPATLYLATGLVANGKGSVAPDALTWSQLAEAVATGLVTVGSHTHSHPNLSYADESLAEDEMRRSKELIEDRLGVACRHFAYPFAVGSPAADRVARRMFETVAVGAWRINRSSEIDRYRLGRTPVLRSDGRAFFRAKLKGMLETEGWAYRALGRGPWRWQ